MSQLALFTPAPTKRTPDAHLVWWCPACKAAPGVPCKGSEHAPPGPDSVGAGWIHGMRAQCRMGEYDPCKPLSLILAWGAEVAA